VFPTLQDGIVNRAVTRRKNWGERGGEIFIYALAYVFEFLKLDAIFAARE
jgi:hypothetical protein